MEREPTEPWDDPREELLSVMRRPRKPKQLLPHDWAALEADLGFALPEDFKWYFDSYGKGLPWDTIWPTYPFDKAFYSFHICDFIYSYKEFALDLLESERGSLKAMKSTCPFPFYPEPNGLFPIGKTISGTALFLLCEGDEPNCWPVVASGIFDSRPVYSAADMEGMKHEFIKAESDGFLCFLTDLIGLRSSFFDEVIKREWFEVKNKFKREKPVEKTSDIPNG